MAFRIVSDKQINDTKLVSGIIKTNCLKFIGELGMSRAGIIVLEDKYQRNKGLIRVNHKYLDELRAGLALIKDMTFTSMGASGILKKAENKYLKEAM